MALILFTRTQLSVQTPFEPVRNPGAGGVPSELISTEAQSAIEEANLTGIPVSIGLTNTLGTGTKKAREDHIHRVDNLTQSSYSPRMTTIPTTVGGTVTLVADSNYSNVFTGSNAPFNVKLPDATTLKTTPNGATKYEFFNDSAVPVSILYNDTSLLYQVAINSYVEITLFNNATTNGEWLIVVSDFVDITNPDFAGVKDGFEDFMFDAYAGNGGNDNQYSFTAVPNAGSSDIDGAVTVVGNDYEGIHTLSTLASATSRPLVHAFNGVNRIKLGAQPESYEIRVRIDQLQTQAENFTGRYGLMDGILIGQPVNGIYFSYLPIGPIAPVAQVFSITWTRANNTLYQVTINGTTVSYTSDATATDAEIALGIGSAINANATISPFVTSQTAGKPILVTSDIPGTPFTCTTSANMTATQTVANVVEVVYSGKWLANVMKASTLTTLDTGISVVAGQFYRLKAVINAAGTDTFIYIDGVFINKITAPVPLAGLRFVFKIEKSLGVTPRTSSIDYITWRRTRG